ncbi:N-acetylmuramate alpha-1-phosphate uridylyltransferase MurU [Asticcacaulis excentricus]|uniref:Nucleotidyl transferase n=1 Tax=Asticcacaulis excentricus (strain ATCC 15261 / DSM 4724 / KCTC 12464 / NCIMB 9791 / VKM B-1370 / CB 48) TaxID=573065 RepID=E8RNF2_ASTEC|nr:nucleotidyltransferase family protein [Asticcacaulis excentricus]ADU11783.1 Nucleotidyl transferase [Asticcacaulis excentricus CB 48]
MTQIRTAMVLAAGLGTRMRPLTDDRPKALVEVGGRTLIDHMIDRLKGAGVERFVVNVHYFADRLEAHLKSRNDVEIVISDEREKLLETGGGLKKARPLLGDDPIFVANIDSVWIEDGGDECAIADMLRQWQPDHMDALLLLADMTRSSGFDGAGDFFLNEDQRLTFRGQAGSAPFNYMGVHVTQPSIVADVAEDAFSLTPIWRQKAAEGRLFGARLHGDWMHVGDPAARDAAEARLQRA